MEQNLSFLKGDPATCVPQAQQTRRQNLYNLYGDAVLPSEWLNFFNFDLGSLCHISADDRCLEDLRRTGFDLLHKYVMKIEEKPVVTRFFYLLLVLKAFSVSSFARFLQKFLSCQ